MEQSSQGQIDDSSLCNADVKVDVALMQATLVFMLSYLCNQNLVFQRLCLFNLVFGNDRSLLFTECIAANNRITPALKKTFLRSTCFHKKCKNNNIDANKNPILKFCHLCGELKKTRFKFFSK